MRKLLSNMNLCAEHEIINDLEGLNDSIFII